MKKHVTLSVTTTAFFTKKKIQFSLPLILIYFFVLAATPALQLYSILEMQIIYNGLVKDFLSRVSGRIKQILYSPR